ncbi:MAG TPA: hypothetical protein VD907_02265 [Verrucomicrobiae bacterium]|nr:hypothetical protein [Verrucomicrobiae bacterium]
MREMSPLIGHSIAIDLGVNFDEVDAAWKKLDPEFRKAHYYDEDILREAIAEKLQE